MGKMVQVGTMALRSPDGTPLPAVPLYAEFPDKDINESGLTSVTEKHCDMIFEEFLYKKFKQYADGLQKAGLKFSD